MAMEADTTEAGRAGIIRRLWNWFWRPAPTIALGTLAGGGLLLGVLLWGDSTGHWNSPIPKASASPAMR